MKWLQRLIDLIRGKKRVVIAPAPEPSQPEPLPEPVAPEPEPVAERMFIWQPEAGRVVVTVPRDHWQWSLTVTSPSVHHTQGLIGNSRGGGVRVPGGWQYTLEGGGEYWRERSLAIDPAGRGAVVFFVNLNGPDPVTGWTATHWVVPDPRQRHEAHP